LYISNLWYELLDQPGTPAATRFATFWVENGEIQAPVSTMRFDDSAYSLLSSQLEALTEGSCCCRRYYNQRATASALLPGAYQQTHADPVNTNSWELRSRRSQSTRYVEFAGPHLARQAVLRSVQTVLHTEGPCPTTRLSTLSRPLDTVGRRHCFFII
jgi:hypothetical protein